MSLSDSKMRIEGHLNRKIGCIHVDRRNLDIAGPILRWSFAKCHERVANKTDMTSRGSQ